METNEENVIWRGHPSQLLNFASHLVALLLAVGIITGAALSGIWPLAAAVILPLGWSLWKYLTVRCRVFELTSERLRLYDGVLNQEIDELELYRVKDTTLVRPFWLRVFGLSTLIAETSDRSHPTVHLEAIRDGMKVRELLRKQVESLRDKKRVREVDFDGSEGDELEFEH
ncbi:PH domain-containing protein [Roseibacillus ishigakijimensis]|uniref:PH domain-containing protein n=1 Tax=Roseibacillus ishigakijimensis TaxID=454146 RepID=A0A934VNJ4_9BACT|nr:PH domain-containing protein [Roseibacillus ishigakijimensis]MBK1835367.1 PH domain-containing protein [Roseibacillus ishigakijimensis]